MGNGVTGHAYRQNGIDALRGVAVVLMVSQHLIAWLWNRPPLPGHALAQAHPILMGLDTLGYLSAPLFIVLAGVRAHPCSWHGTAARVPAQRWFGVAPMCSDWDTR